MIFVDPYDRAMRYGHIIITDLRYLVSACNRFKVEYPGQYPSPDRGYYHEPVLLSWPSRLLYRIAAYHDFEATLTDAENIQNPDTSDGERKVKEEERRCVDWCNYR